MILLPLQPDEVSRLQQGQTSICCHIPSSGARRSPGGFLTKNAAPAMEENS
jgi:hypothetical protein